MSILTTFPSQARPAAFIGTTIGQRALGRYIKTSGTETRRYISAATDAGRYEKVSRYCRRWPAVGNLRVIRS